MGDRVGAGGPTLTTFILPRRRRARTLVGCLRGFEARESAESVGRTPTSAIVSGIFAIILSDAVFTVLFNVWWADRRIAGDVW